MYFYFAILGDLQKETSIIEKFGTIFSFFLSFGVQTRVEDAENKAGDFENRTEKVESTGTDSVKGIQS